MRFLLDTGATHTSVPAHLAQRLGLQPGVASTVSTANGTVVVRGTRIEALDMGPFRFAGAPAHLNPGMRDDDVLLGMSVLKHLEFTSAAMCSYSENPPASHFGFHGAATERSGLGAGVLGNQHQGETLDPADPPLGDPPLG